MKLFIDTETTGIPKFKNPAEHPEQPHLVQLAAILSDDYGTEVASINLIINNGTLIIPPEATRVHGISTEIAKKYGVSLSAALKILSEMIEISDLVIAHNINFDAFILEIAASRTLLKNSVFKIEKRYCTMRSSMALDGLPLNHAGKKKFPRLAELYNYAFGENFENAHDAMADCRAMMRIFWWLQEQKL